MPVTGFSDDRTLCKVVDNIDGFSFIRPLILYPYPAVIHRYNNHDIVIPDIMLRHFTVALDQIMNRVNRCAVINPRLHPVTFG